MATPQISGRYADGLGKRQIAGSRFPAAATRKDAPRVTGVARSASDTTAAASSTSQAADELARMASDLRQLVGQFSY